MYVRECAGVNAGSHRVQKKTTGARVPGARASWPGHQEPNLGLLQEQYVLLTTEPAQAPPTFWEPGSLGDCFLSSRIEPAPLKLSYDIHMHVLWPLYAPDRHPCPNNYLLRSDFLLPSIKAVGWSLMSYSLSSGCLQLFLASLNYLRSPQQSAAYRFIA